MSSDAEISPNMAVGDWLWFPNMGAYTACAGSNFNGMALPDVIYLQAQGGAKPQPAAAAAAAMVRQLRREGVTASPPGTGRE